MNTLLAEVNALLPALAPSQDRQTVRNTLDSRTVRYYTTRGLLPRPSAYTGGRAHYGPSHVLRLAFIKHLQAEHQSLKTIERTLKGLSDDDILEALTGLRRPQQNKEQPAKPAPMVSKTQAAPFHTASQETRQASTTQTPLTLPSAVDQTLRPLPLSPGGEVNVPEALLTDPDARLKLADSLEALAAWLRATTDN